MRDKNMENKYVESNYILNEISHSDDNLDKDVTKSGTYVGVLYQSEI